MKVIQYACKIALWTDQGKRAEKLKIIISQFSQTRKIIRLFNFLGPLSNLPSLQSLIEVVNDCSDDVICFGKMGLVPAPLASSFNTLSDRCWFICILLDLSAATSKVMVEKRGKEAFLARISWLKLFADLIFCGYDVFGLKVDDRIQDVSGFISGVLSLYKLWLKHSKI